MYPNISGETVNRLFYWKEKPILEVKISYPQIMGNLSKSSEDAFNCYYRSDARRLNYRVGTYCRKKALSEAENSFSQQFPFTMHSYLRTYTVMRAEERYVSLLFDLYRYMGGMHGVLRKYGNTWDISTGKRISLSYFFKEDVPYQKVILNEIAKQIREQTEKEEIPFYRNPLRNAAKFFREENYYLTDNAVVVFYPMYTLAAYYGGIPAYQVPFEQLERYWKNNKRPKNVIKAPQSYPLNMKTEYL